MQLNLVSVSNVSYFEGDNHVLTNIQLSQRAFEKIVIAGETGSGKSTLLKIMAGLLQPTAGQVTVGGEHVKGPAEQLVPGHPSIAYLSQHFELQKSLRVEQVLTYANTLAPTREAKIVSICRINHLLKRRTDELSGGEKQRIAIARLLIQQPKLLLLDEPFSNLDRILKGILKSVVDDIGRKLKITCVLVSHDPEDTLPWADAIIVLKRGKIIQRGSAQDIYYRPVNTYVAGLFGNYTLLNRFSIRKLGIKSNLPEIIARPEQFQITREGTKTISCKVENVHFYGDHYLVQTENKGQPFFVTSDHGRYNVGDTVHLKFLS